jgi:hypothetical protein
VYSCNSLVRYFVLVVLGYRCLVFYQATAMYIYKLRLKCYVFAPIVDAYIASIAIRIMSDTRDEEKDRNKDQRSKVCCKTPKIQEITVRYIIPVIYLIV